MFPIRDHTPTLTFPFVNYGIILVTVLAFLMQLAAPDFEAFITAHAFIPANFSPTDPAAYLPILNSIFLHGGLFHIASNLWFLHIFGDNVEDRMGHAGYLVFYLLCGVAAAFSQYVFATGSTIPMIGASGAISGVTGAYMLFYSASKIEALVPTGYFMQTVLLPSWFFLGYWFLIQVFSGVGSLATVNEGGVAFFAHVGGFLAGLFLGPLFARRPGASPPGSL